MWPEEAHSGQGRTSTGSEVVITNGHLQAPAPGNLPPCRPVLINTMHLANSPRSHVGDKYVTVTNVTQNDQVIKDLPCTAYMWAYVKNSTRAERLCCSVATLILALSISLAVYFSVFYNNGPDTPFDSEGWYISRDEWLASPYNNTDIEAEFAPIPLVSIQHSVSNECYRFAKCASELRNLQNYFITKFDRDIPYNFLIGNDGRVYEGRGWRKEGAHTLKYNKCTVGIGFIGDYREEKGIYTKVTQQQQKHMYQLLQEGVEKGLLHPDFQIAAALDITSTASPGSNLYKAMQQWPHYDQQHRFRNKSCDDIIHMVSRRNSYVAL